MTKKVDILIKNVLIMTMNDEQEIISNGNIAIKNGKIFDINKGIDYKANKEINGEKMLALPGLINAHTHSTLTRGVAEDLRLMDWLNNICFPLDAAYTPEIMKASAKLNQLEMLKCGTTTFADLYLFEDVVAEVLKESGLRGFLSTQVIDDQEDACARLEDNIELYNKWHGTEQGRINIWFGVHAPYSNHSDTYKKAKYYSDKFEVGIHTHVAETKDEVEYVQKKYDKTPVEYLYDLGVLNEKLLAAHCVHLTERDQNILAEQGVPVAYNPVSNMKLASGIPPMQNLLNKGVTITLGTDSNLSNNNLDLFEEMKVAGLLQKVNEEDASALPCYEILKMATINAARALGVSNEIGSLEKEKKADIILMDLNAPHLWPLLDGEDNNISNLVEHIVYSANGSDVKTVMVDGKILMEDRKVNTLNEVETFQNVQHMTKKLCNKAFD